jgi:cytochrome oxidase Cu insertion factor (SCO1/SenC/PrrC family)
MKLVIGRVDRWFGVRARGGCARRRATGVLVLLVLLSSPVAAAADLEDLLWDLQLIPLEGPIAPAFTLTNLTGGKVTLQQFRGRVVLLYFWATW